MEEKQLKGVNGMSEAYKNAGVDIEAGYEAVKRMKTHVERTKEQASWVL